MALKFTNLKRGIFTTPQAGTKEFERYIIENVEDLKAFAKAFPAIKMKPFNMHNNLLQNLKEGHIIIATDTNPVSGFPTYCFEETNGDTHPCCYHRVRVL